MIIKYTKALLMAGLIAFNTTVMANDAGKTMEQVCAENGFATESYTVTTSDDYILELYRIPGTTKEAESTQQEQKPAVLFVHALDGDMMEWVVNDPDKANAFILAREGYDVWMGNNRGNRFSTGHKTLSRKDKEYWDYW